MTENYLDDPLIMEAVERLQDDPKMSGRKENLVLGALMGLLDDVIEGCTVERPEGRPSEDQAPVQAYLESISVTGFRGIGPACKLDLSPRPGLTLVVGRNGSGKSSLAEGAELALTGESLRLAQQAKEWQSAWKNLHQGDAPRIEVGLRMDGEPELRTVQVEWDDKNLDSTKSSVNVEGKGQQTLESLGWETAVKTFRPFLSYLELSKIIEGRPIDRYNSLAPMLGMESLQRPLEELKAERKALDERVKESKRLTTEALQQLERVADERADAAINALNEQDLDQLRTLLTGNDSDTVELNRLLRLLAQLPAPSVEQAAQCAGDLVEAEQKLEALQGTDIDRADKTRELLESAIAIHDRYGDMDCPVCDRDTGLQTTRVEELKSEVERLGQETRNFSEAKQAATAARKHARQAIGAQPQVLTEAGASRGVDLSRLIGAWETWANEPGSDSQGFDQQRGATELAAHLKTRCQPVVEATEEVRQAAQKRQAELADVWRPIADMLAEMLPSIQKGKAAKVDVTALRAAEKWLKGCEKTIRSERFAAVSAQIKDAWELLAVGSNVSLEEVNLGTRKVDMDVTVDGHDSAALGVMSRGELYALALSLFVPRVKMSDSPFKFVMLDDPVQSMDPIRVDGLARLLNDLAQTHQIIVFTHDDRLRSAVDRLQIAANVWSVTRRPGSRVAVERSLDPIQAAIDSARALSLSEKLPSEVARQVVPGLCREALDAACVEAGTRQLLKAGISHAECEKTITDTTKLVPRIAIALFGDPDRGSDVYSTLSNKFDRRAVDTVKSCNEMTHRGAPAGHNLSNLIKDTDSLARKLAEL